eukprot:UN06069
MTLANMCRDTKPTIMTSSPTKAEEQQQPKLVYYGRDITNRLASLTLYVRDTDPCPKIPQCPVDCKHVTFKDNSTTTINSHLTKYPSKDSTF